MPPCHGYPELSPSRLRVAFAPPGTSAVDTTQNTVRIVVSRVVNRTVSPPSKRITGSPFATFGTSLGTAAPFVWVPWLPSPDWSAQESPSPPGTPASARHHSFRPATCFGVASASRVNPATAVPLADSPSFHPFAFTVSVDDTTSGPSYSPDSSVGSVPSSVYRICAPAVCVWRLTSTESANTPPAGEIEGVATCSPIPYFASR